MRERMFSIRLAGALLQAGLAGCHTSPVGEGESARKIDWPVFGGSAAQSRYFEYAAITPENVGELKVAWVYPVADGNIYQFSPVIADGVMYVLANNNSLVALDA